MLSFLLINNARPSINNLISIPDPIMGMFFKKEILFNVYLQISTFSLNVIEISVAGVTPVFLILR